MNTEKSIHKSFELAPKYKTPMVDIGVNLTNSRFDKDFDAVLERSKNANISQLLITGTSVEESRKALSLCQAHQMQYPDYLYCTAGVHPHDADNVTEDYLNDLSALASQPSVRAIGECGLDFNRNFSTPEKQLKVFSEQVALAASLEMPLFLHQRDAFEPWFATLAPYLNKIPAMVAHCFTGTKSELEQCLAANMYIGITGWICDERRGQELREIVDMIPLNRLMIETDAPYLTPRNIRPKPKSSRNEPAYLSYVLKEIADITGVDANDIACQTSANADAVFNFSGKAS